MGACQLCTELCSLELPTPMKYPSPTLVGPWMDSFLLPTCALRALQEMGGHGGRTTMRTRIGTHISCVVMDPSTSAMLPPWRQPTMAPIPGETPQIRFFRKLSFFAKEQLLRQRGCAQWGTLQRTLAKKFARSLGEMRTSAQLLELANDKAAARPPTSEHKLQQLTEHEIPIYAVWT